jgi:hypothetical protein
MPHRTKNVKEVATDKFLAEIFAQVPFNMGEVA